MNTDNIAMEFEKELKGCHNGNIPSNWMKEIMRDIAVKMCEDAHFIRYNHDWKNEMVEHAIFKMNIAIDKKWFNFNQTNFNAYDAFIMITKHAFMNVIRNKALKANRDKN